MSELNNEMVMDQNEMVSEEKENKSCDGWLAAAAGLGCVGVGYLIHVGVTKIKERKAKKAEAKTDEAPKEKKEKFHLFKRKAKEPEKVEEVEATNEEES